MIKTVNKLTEFGLPEQVHLLYNMKVILILEPLLFEKDSEILKVVVQIINNIINKGWN